jgi:hypothetical protein
MFAKVRSVMFAALSASLLSVAPLAEAAAPADPPEVVHGGPRPAPLAETLPPAPEPGVVWVPGHWSHKAFSDEWVWQAGYYETAGGVVVARPAPVVVAPAPVVVARPVIVHRYWYPWRVRVGVGWRWHRW